MWLIKTGAHSVLPLDLVKPDEVLGRPALHFIGNLVRHLEPPCAIVVSYWWL